MVWKKYNSESRCDLCFLPVTRLVNTQNAFIIEKNLEMAGFTVICRMKFDPVYDKK